jgi:3-oxoacyl-[acyl-carrier-protein] synthase II
MTPGRSTQFGLVAAAFAVEDAGLTSDSYESTRVAVIGGSTVAEPQVGEALISLWRRQGLDAVPRRQFAQLSPGTITANIARALGFHGPNAMMLTSCTAGNQAIGHACDLIRKGRVDAALVGGTDSLSMMNHVGFNRLLSLAPEYCQPFDRNRKGLVIGEGSAFLVIERLADAVARDAHIHGEILGTGLGFDAHHMTRPHPDGRGGAQAIRAAVTAAGIRLEDVDYISAHGTGTHQNDRIESKLVRDVFGERAYDIPISSIKSMLGHTMGAASAIEAVACLLSLQRGVLPPTIHYETPDPECDLDYVPNQARRVSIRVALSQAFAFGGNTSALVLGRHEPVDGGDSTRSHRELRA